MDSSKTTVQPVSKKPYVRPAVTDLGNAVEKTLGGVDGGTTEIFAGLPSGWALA